MNSAAQSLMPNQPLEVPHPNFWEVHQQWVNKLFQFVIEKANSRVVEYPDDQEHPIYYFTRKDAREILLPIFRNFFGFNLSTEIIDSTFFEKLPIVNNNFKTSDIELFRKKEVKNEVFRIAQKVHQQVEGQILFLLGQTPAYLGIMVQSLDQQRTEKTGTQIIQIPFSGHPNYIQPSGRQYANPMAFLNILTSEREQFFQVLMRQKGFSPEFLKNHKKKIFILDNSSGPSITCFLAILKKWFHDLLIPLPELHFLHMCSDRYQNVKKENGRWVPHHCIDFTFDETLKFEIPILFLGMREDIAFQFDHLYFNLRIVPPFNSIHWQKEYAEQVLPLYPSTEAKILINEYCQHVHRNSPLYKKKREGLEPGICIRYRTHVSSRGHTEAVQTPFKAGCPNSRGHSALQLASEKGLVKIVRALIKKGIFLDARDPGNQTALMWAAWGGHAKIVQALLKGGATPDLKDFVRDLFDHWTALMLAAWSGHAAVVRVLLKGGACVDECNLHHWTALMLAVKNGHSEVVRSLLEGGASIEAKNSKNQTPLLLGAQSNRTEIIRLLLQKGASTEVGDFIGWTPLMWAAYLGHAEVIGILLENGASIEATDSENRTSLIIASWRGHAEIVSILLKKGRKMTSRSVSHSRVLVR